MDQLVYHYCSVKTFVSIIKNKSLRFSDITKSNDSSEIKWIATHIKSVFQDEYKKRIKENPILEVKNREIDFFKLLDGFYRAYFDYAICGRGKFFWFYASCFSLEDDMLSQWRGYADDGKGFCIGFDREAFERYSTSNFKLLSIHSGDVDYCEKRHIEVVRKCFAELLNNLDIHVNYNNLNEEAKFYFKNCFQNLIEKAVFIKNPFFHEEKEWRMCVWTFKELSDSDTITLVNNGVPEFYPLDYQVKNNEMVSFFDLKISPDMVKRIILGPMNKTDLSDLALFLRSNGFDCELDRSKGTYINND